MITLRAGAARDLGAERRALVAVELDQREPQRVGGLRDLVERRVDEHADESRRGGAARRAMPGRVVGVAARGEPGQRIIPTAQAPQLDGELGVLGTGDAADLDARVTPAS